LLRDFYAVLCCHADNSELCWCSVLIDHLKSHAVDGKPLQVLRSHGNFMVHLKAFLIESDNAGPVFERIYGYLKASSNQFLFFFS
jgi:hypothetical protein